MAMPVHQIHAMKSCCFERMSEIIKINNAIMPYTRPTVASTLEEGGRFWRIAALLPWKYSAAGPRGRTQQRRKGADLTLEDCLVKK